MGIINENTEITIDEESNTITFANQGKNGDIYINTFTYRQKEKTKDNEEEKEED